MESKSYFYAYNYILRKAPDYKKILSKTNIYGLVIERDENDECFQECKVISKGIRDLVKKDVWTAETEAKASKALVEALK